MRARARMGTRRSDSAPALASLAAVAVLAFSAASCGKLDPLSAPAPVTGEADFTRYVAIGTSVSMGIQNAGLVDEFQAASFPARMAEATRAPSFVQPLVASPGIPPVLELAGFTPSPGAFPILTPRPGVEPTAPYVPRPANGYSNLGISGAFVANVLAKTSGDDPAHYFDLVLQGQGTVIRQTLAQDPTFVTVELGLNEAVRGVLLGGDPMFLLSAGAFEAQYGQVMDSLALGAPDAKLALVNVPDVTRIPYANAIPLDVTATVGNSLVTYRVRDASGPLPDSALVLLHAATLLQQGYGSPIPGAPPLPDSVVITVAERRSIAQAAAAYSAAIARAAQARGAALVDFAALFDDAFKHGVHAGGATYTFAYISGGLFSLDGVHPNSLGHALLANEAIRAINARFGGSIAPVALEPPPLTRVPVPFERAALPFAPIVLAEGGHR